MDLNIITYVCLGIIFNGFAVIETFDYLSKLRIKAEYKEACENYDKGIIDAKYYLRPWSGSDN